MDAVRRWPVSRARAGWWRREVAAPTRRGTTSTTPTSTAAATAEPSVIAFWALLAFTLILLTAPQNLVPALAPFRIALLSAGVAIGAHVWHLFTYGRRLPAASRELRITLALVAWVTLTIPLSYWPGGSLGFLLTVYIKTVAIFWLLGELVTTLARLRCVAWAMTLMSLPLAATAVKNFLTGDFFVDATQVKRIIGFDAPLTENPNDLALMLNLILPLAVGLLLGTQHPVLRVVLLGVIGLDAVAVILTFSRAGFLTLAMIMAAYLWKLRRRPGRQWRWIAVGLAFACLPLLPAGYSSRLGTITDIEADHTGSSRARWADSVAAARYVLQHPVVGAGLAMNVLALNEVRGPTWKAVHNVYLEYGVELGLPGLVLFVLLVIAVVRKASAIARQSADGHPELFYLAGGIHVSLLAFALAALFHPNGYQFPFYYIAGLAVALPAVYEAEAARRREGHR